MTASESRLSTIQRRIQTSTNEITQMVNNRFAHLPFALLYTVPKEGEWSLMENLAHIIEFLPYWADEIRKLVQRPGQSFGRTMQHEGRLRAIREHGHDTLDQVKARLPISYEHINTVIQSLHEQDLDLTGVHSKFGTQTLVWFIEEFVTGHLEAHIVQMHECLATVQHQTQTNN